MPLEPKRPVRSLELLEKLRAAEKRLATADGLLRLGGFALFLAWGAFLLDWTLHLPLAIRLFHVAAIFGLTFAGLRYFLAGLRRRLDEVALAARVEAVVPGFREALITAVDLAGSPNPHAALYSPGLLARTIEDADKRAAGVEARSLVSSNAAFVSLMACAILSASWAFLAIQRPDLGTTFLRRHVLLADEPWPREHEFAVLEPVAEDTKLAMGDSLNIVAQRLRGGESRVVVKTFGDGGAKKDEYPLEKKGIDLYRRLFRNVAQDFEFVVAGGDYESRTYSVRVRNRPRIEDIALVFDYPAYTGLTDVTEPRSDLGGHAKVPVGTVIGYIAKASIPIRSARFVEEWREGNEDKHAERDLAISDELTITGQFTAEREGFYYFRLVSTDNFENPNPIRFRVGLIHDHAPAAQVTKPGKNIEVTARARVLATFEAQDDYGVTDATMVFRVGTDEPGATPNELRVPGAVIAAPTKTVTGEVPIDLEAWAATPGGLAIEPGKRIEYFVEALDSLEQLGTSRTFVLTVVRDDELARIFQDMLVRIRDQLEDALKSQRENQSAVMLVLEAVRLGSGRLDEKSVAELRSARLRQEKVSTRAEESLDMLVEVIERTIANRLASSVRDLPWMEGVRVKLAAVAEDLAPPALSGIDGLARVATGGGVVDGQSVAQALDQQGAMENALAALVQELGEWGDIRTMIRKMEELLELEKQLELRVGERLRGG